MNVLLKSEAGLASPDLPLTRSKPASHERHVTLVEGLNLSSPTAQLIIGNLSRLQREHENEIAPWFGLWQEHCGCYFDLKAAEEILADEVRAAAGARLFLAHTYCKIVLCELQQLALGRSYVEDDPSLYNWVACIEDDKLIEMRAGLRRSMAAVEDLSGLDAVSWSNLLAMVYQEILPPALRHLLGEYYTPSWLVEYCINQVERRHRKPDAPITILDPAAGSGSFLAHYVTHLSSADPSLAFNIVGFDVNPLAVDFCRANILIAASKVRTSGNAPQVNVRVHLADAVVDPTVDSDGPLFGVTDACRKMILGVVFSEHGTSDPAIEQAIEAFRPLPTSTAKAFERTLRQYVDDTFAATKPVYAQIIVGNPPWITWDGLTWRYREKVAPQWASSSLVTNTGWRAKVAAGKTDFSSLFVYRAAQRHAAGNATMVFVLPLSLFQSRLAGAGFRTFRTAEGRTFALVELDDFSDVKVFPDAVNRTSVGTFAVDQAPRFPIRYATWSGERSNSSSGRVECISSLGGPLDPSEAHSPIVAFEQGQTQLQTIVGKSDYRARGGVNTGGANTILWLDVLSHTDGLCRVRNVGKSRRGSSPVVTAEVEREAVYPLLCGTDMRRWKAAPSRNILLLYNPEQPKKALPVNVVQTNMPRAFEFVSRFRAELEGRKEYHRWGCSGPFYEAYRIGPYTFSPIKVVWQHTGYRKALNVSVVDDRGRRPTIPDQKAILIPFDDLEEAHYACAFLASSITAALLDRYLGTDASTHILDYVALRRFDPRNKDHRHLARLSVQAHEAASRSANVSAVEGEIDGIMERILSIT